MQNVAKCIHGASRRRFPPRGKLAKSHGSRKISERAVFSSVGPFPQTLQSTWARIAAEWLPESGYEFREGPQILWNESPDTTKPDFRSEIWVPVVKR